MSEHLGLIERKLERLEGGVLQEYATCKLAALSEGRERVIMDEEALERFRRELETLKTALYATGDTRKLQIVSEHHDALRIRMIYIQHLLEREIPRPYVDQALQEFTRAPYGAHGSLPTAATPPPSKGSLLGRVFQRAEPPKPAAPPKAAPPITNEMRLVHLHKLMQEDRMHLMAPTERPPRIQGDAPLSEAAYRFKVKFIAETHHGQRVATEKIAKTPEELRAKLAKRLSEEQGGK